MDLGVLYTTIDAAFDNMAYSSENRSVKYNEFVFFLKQAYLIHEDRVKKWLLDRKEKNKLYEQFVGNERYIVENINT